VPRVNIETISGHMDSEGVGLRVDMKLLKFRYERNTTRTGSGVRLYGHRVGDEVGAGESEEAAHPQTTQIPQPESAEWDAPPGVGQPHEPDGIVSSSRRTGGCGGCVYEVA